MSIAVPLYGFSGSGGEGGKLTVTAPAGAAVTITKDGKTKTKVAGADGVVVFKGLANGKWAVSTTKDGVPITRNVDVTSEYSTTIGLFSATISITYPAGFSCTCSDGATEFSAPDTSGTWACTVPNAGTWTVASTSGTDSDSEIVSITADGQSVSVELSYAKYLFKPNDACEDVTGGWSVDTQSESVTYGDELVIKSVNYYNSNRTEEVHTNNQIDMTAYRTLQATCKASGGSATKLIVLSGSSDVASGEIGATLGTVTVDVSALSGLYNIGFSGRHSAYAAITYTATEIKLMK